MRSRDNRKDTTARKKTSAPAAQKPKSTTKAPQSPQKPVVFKDFASI